MNKKGYIQIYTGNGKGKTTAALGLILRASGAGLKIYLGQFIKRGKTSELKALEQKFPNVTVESYGQGGFIKDKPTKEDIKRAWQGYLKLSEAVTGKEYDMVIADEINIAISIGLLSAEDVLALMERKPANVELVLTGRSADPRLIKRADLVTEMKEIKHYFAAGVTARQGIER